MTPNIAKALVAAQHAVQAAMCDGYNAEKDHAYATANQILTVSRGPIQAAGLAVLASEFEPALVGGRVWMVRLFSVVDASGEREDFTAWWPWWSAQFAGEGEEAHLSWAGLDTYSRAYFLRSLLMIPLRLPGEGDAERRPGATKLPEDDRRTQAGTATPGPWLLGKALPAITANSVSESELQQIVRGIADTGRPLLACDITDWKGPKYEKYSRFVFGPGSGGLRLAFGFSHRAAKAAGGDRWIRTDWPPLPDPVPILVTQQAPVVSEPPSAVSRAESGGDEAKPAGVTSAPAGSSQRLRRGIVPATNADAPTALPGAEAGARLATGGESAPFNAGAAPPSSAAGESHGVTGHGSTSPLHPGGAGGSEGAEGVGGPLGGGQAPGARRDEARGVAPLGQGGGGAPAPDVAASVAPVLEAGAPPASEHCAECGALLVDGACRECAALDALVVLAHVDPGLAPKGPVPSNWTDESGARAELAARWRTCSVRTTRDSVLERSCALCGKVIKARESVHQGLAPQSGDRLVKRRSMKPVGAAHSGCVMSLAAGKDPREGEVPA